MRALKRFFTYENSLVSIMFFAYGLLWVDRLSIVYLFDFIGAEMSLNHTQLGMTMSVVAITWGLSSLLFSYVSDRFGTKKKILIICLLLFSICTFFTGFATSFAGLLIARAIMGFAEGPVGPLIQTTVLAESTVKRRGFNAGFVNSAYQLIGVGLTPIVTIYLATAFNWRIALYVLAIPGIIMAFVLMKMMREPHVHDDRSIKKEKQSFKDFLSIFKERNIIILTLISIFYMASLFTLSTFIPQFLRVEAGYSDNQVSVIMGALGVVGFLWYVLVPTISDRIGRRPTMIFFGCINVLLPVGILLLNGSFTLMLIAIVLLISGQGIGTLYGFVIPNESVSKALATTACAFVLLIGELIGGAFGPAIGGMLADTYSLNYTFIFTAIVSAVVFLLTFALKETAPVIVSKIVTQEVNEPLAAAK